MVDCKEFIKEAQEYQKGEVCTTCEEHKPLSEFFKDRTSKRGVMYNCKACVKKYSDKQCRFKKWFVCNKGRATRWNQKFEIEPEDIPGVKIKWNITIDRLGRKFKSWEGVEYPKVCPVFGVELDFSIKSRPGGKPNSPSLDRIDPSKGYTKGNVMVISDLANRMKQNATPEQLKQFGRYHLFGVKSD